MNRLIISWILTLFSILIFDGIWLLLMAKRFYMKHLGHLMAVTPNLLPALFFYLLYSFGLAYFILVPELKEHESLLKLFFTGALFGLIAYSTYDLTNQATLKNWSTLVTLVDLAWGALLTGTVVLVAAFVTKYFE